MSYSNNDAAPIDLMLIGEFCEKDGPVVRHLYALGENGQVECFPPDRWPPGADDALHQFMMRAMSGDHVFPEKPDTPLQYRACEVLMDRIKWVDDSHLVAYISSVTLFDVFARGYARTACVAYLSNDEHKMFTISHWLSMECQSITRKLFDLTFLTHKAEMVQCVDALELLKKITRDAASATNEAEAALPEGLTDRHRNHLQLEIDALRSRVMRSVTTPLTATKKSRRGTALNSALSHSRFGSDESPQPDSFEFALQDLRSNSSIVLSPPNASLCTERSLSNISPASPSMSVDDAIDIANRLITLKGCGVLRPLASICALNGFSDVEMMIQKTMWAFAMDTVWLMENILQVMRPLPDLLERPLGDILASLWPTHEATGGRSQRSPLPLPDEPLQESNPFLLKIGDCVVVDPYLRRNPPAPKPGDHELLTCLLEGNLFSVLREYGVGTMISLMFSALACTPIVVCGETEEDVLYAMRLAATFVPGLLQGRHRDKCEIALFPMAEKVTRVAYDDLEKYAIVGCHPSAILDTKTGKPYLPAACVWHIQTGNQQGRKGQQAKTKTIAFWGASYNVQKVSTNSAAQSAERLNYVDPMGLDVALPQASVASPVGLLTEVHDLLMLKTSSRNEEYALTNYLRLTLKRIFLDYGTMAASVLCSVLHEVHHKPVAMHSGYLNTSVTSPLTGTSGGSAKKTPQPALNATPPSHPLSHGHVVMPAALSNNSLSASPFVAAPPSGPCYCPHKAPFVLTEVEVKQVLRSHHGYTSLHSDDMAIVTNIVKRMATLAEEYEPLRRPL